MEVSSYSVKSVRGFQFESPNEYQANPNGNQCKAGALDANGNRIIRKCDLCPKEAKFACSRCENSWSCSSLHGSFHQLTGSNSCAPFQVRCREGVGRLLIASRDIQAGEVIAVEEPLIVGPNQESAPICLGCLAEIDTSYLCSRCGYPMCDQDCSNSEIHLQECPVLSRGPRPTFTDCSLHTTAYHCILPLRLLMLQDQDKANLLQQFMDHREERIGSEYWKTSQLHVVNHLRSTCNLSQYSEEDLHRAVGLLEVNSYELHSYGSAGYRGPLAIGSILSHSCSANSRLVFGREPPFTTTLLAAVDIPKGAEITGSYLDPLMPAVTRRPMLSFGWYFDCACKRCLDPTELGTHLNTLLCQKCRLEEKNSFLLPENVRNQNGDWRCDGCENIVRNEEAKKLVEKFNAEILQLSTTDRYNTEAWIKVRENALKCLHPCHQVLCDVARWLIPILCRGPGKLYTDFPKQMLNLKYSMCLSYLRTLNTIEPGVSRNRAKTLYELVDLQLHQINQQQQHHNDAAKGLIARLYEIIFIFEKLGTKSQFEVYILTQAKQHLYSMKSNAENV